MAGAVIEMILPIVITFLIGVMTRKLRLINENGCATIKTIVSKIMLPVVLLNAFLFADYSLDTVVIIVVIFLAQLAIFGIGYLMKRVIPSHGKYLPFVFSTLECGTLGYPLIAMLYAARGTSDMAIIDVGHTVFLFLLAIPIMQATDGGSPDIKSILKNALTSPTFDAMLLGMALGMLGVDTILASSAAYGSYQAVVNFLTAPTGMLILITLGYDISLRKDLMGPVVFTSVSRLIVSAAFCALSSFIIFRFMPFSKETLVALMLAFALPASYAIPMFAKFEGHKDYVSTTISFSTLLTLLVFVGLTIYAAA
jgi:hypothetical protein